MKSPLAIVLVAVMLVGLSTLAGRASLETTRRSLAIVRGLTAAWKRTPNVNFVNRLRWTHSVILGSKLINFSTATIRS